MNSKTVIGVAALTLAWATLQACSMGRGANAAAAYSEFKVQSDDALIDVRVEGHGPAIVMIPSAGRSSHDFDDLAKRLVSVGFRVVLVDPRGTGSSSGIRPDLTLTDYARDILAVMDELKIKQTVVIAHAAGARDARVAIGLAPQRFSTLVSLDTGASGDASIRSDIDPARAREAHAQVADSAHFSDAVRLQALSLLYFAPGNDSAVWLGGWSNDASEAHSMAARRTAKDKWWPGTPIKSLIIEAKDDAIAPIQGEALRSLLGNDVALVVMPHAGHAMLPEQPKAVAEVVIAYLQGKKDLQSIANEQSR